MHCHDPGISQSRFLAHEVKKILHSGSPEENAPCYPHLMQIGQRHREGFVLFSVVAVTLTKKSQVKT